MNHYMFSGVVCGGRAEYRIYNFAVNRNWPWP
jgi:hypothetical protein